MFGHSVYHSNRNPKTAQMPTLCASILPTPLYVCMSVCYVSAYAHTQLDTEGLQWLSSSAAFYLILDSLVG